MHASDVKQIMYRVCVRQTKDRQDKADKQSPEVHKARRQDLKNLRSISHGDIKGISYRKLGSVCPIFIILMHYKV